jgi:hypothetical protein
LVKKTREREAAVEKKEKTWGSWLNRPIERGVKDRNGVPERGK